MNEYEEMQECVQCYELTLKSELKEYSYYLVCPYCFERLQIKLHKD